MTSESKRAAHSAKDLPAGGDGCALPLTLLDHICDYLPLGSGGGRGELLRAVAPYPGGAFGLWEAVLSFTWGKRRVPSISSEKEAHMLKGLEDF